MKTSELIGSALDWAVAKAEGKSNEWMHDHKIGYVNSASTDWAQGGPIIEREEIELHVLPSGLDISLHPTYQRGDFWEANLWPPDVDIIQICAPTPLVAAMRCYVASKLGDEVEVPEELK